MQSGVVPKLVEIRRNAFKCRGNIAEKGTYNFYVSKVYLFYVHTRYGMDSDHYN